MRTETYNVTTGHVYHVYCALGGNVYKCKDAVAATASVTPLESYAAGMAYNMGIGDGSITYGGFTWTPGEAATPADFVDALNTLGNWGTGPQTPMEKPLVHAELDGDTGKVVLTIVDADWIGVGGNALKVTGTIGTLPISDEAPVSFSGGAAAQRTLIGTTGLDEDSGCEKMVKFEAAAPWARLEVDVTSESAWVLCRDGSLPMVPRAVATEPGKFYHIYADDCIQVYYRNVRLMEHLYFGGVGVVQAPGNELTILASAATEVNMFVCPPADGVSSQHSAFTHYGSGTVF